MTPGWLAALTRHASAATPAILVTVTEARGSAPRDGGAKMVFTASGQDDTVGGGALEHECCRVARDMLRSGATRLAIKNFPLGPALVQCCGGHVTVLFEPVLPPSWDIVVFGAGHVGQAVVRLLGTLPCRVAWVDSRTHLFDIGAPGNVTCVAESIERVAIPPGAMALVMSHDHQLDYRIVRLCLERDDLRFVGLIGSETKRARFLSRLAKDGVSEESRSRLTSPIGLPNVGGKLPAEIAVSVVAQLLAIRDAEPVKSSLAALSSDGECRDCAVGCAA